ncbi:hypothetical protein IW152_004193, partial [Coemansia sp. BCRC 34962]
MNVRDVYSGKSLQRLSNAPYVGCTFPLVRNVRFHLTMDDKFGQTYVEYPSDTAANIAVFTRRIKEIVPKVSEIYVGSDSKLENLPMFQDAYFVDLVRQLFEIVKTTVIMYVSAPLLSYMGIECVRNLVRLECCLEYD